MRLTVWLGLALAFSLPVKATYVDGGIYCNGPYSVEADAVTILEFEEIYWGGWSAAYTEVAIYGPTASASGSGWGWEMDPAVAHASLLSPSAGYYQFIAWHSIYHPEVGLYLLAVADTLCQVGGVEPPPEIWSVNPRGNGYVEIYGNYFDTGGTRVHRRGVGEYLVFRRYAGERAPGFFRSGVALRRNWYR